MPLPYNGSGHYCYANSLSMALGAHSPGPQVIEVLTGSPFGMQILGGKTPLFDPAGWNGDIALDAAAKALGWECERSCGDPDHAERLLYEAGPDNPLLIGPLEAGLLLNQPGRGTPIGADHWVVAMGVKDGLVHFHDPAGYPYSILPVAQFLTAWRAETIDEGDPFTARRGFNRTREVDTEAALRGTLPAAVALLTDTHGHPVAAGTLSNAAAAERLAEMILSGLSDELRGFLVHFAVPVGARRLSDATTCLSRISMDKAAETTETQARLVGSLEYQLVSGRTAEAAAVLRELAPTYAELAGQLG